MAAIVGAVLFGFALLLDLLDTNLGAPDALNAQTLVTAGLLCVALHLAGVGAGVALRGRRWRR
ncbi:MAG TPA: hypothetical protein VFY17_08450 [Pilimelia sp.]|nr:hypothetical protein [Pilimelia sp.]